MIIKITANTNGLIFNLSVQKPRMKKKKTRTAVREIDGQKCVIGTVNYCVSVCKKKN